MNDETTGTESEGNDLTDNNSCATFTQVVTCAENHPHERRRQTLRAILEREAYELRKLKRLKGLQIPLVNSFRNLFSPAKN